VASGEWTEPRTRPWHRVPSDRSAQRTSWYLERIDEGMSVAVSTPVPAHDGDKLLARNPGEPGCSWMTDQGLAKRESRYSPPVSRWPEVDSEDR